MSRSRVFGAVYLSVATSYLGVGLVAPLIAIVLSDRGADTLTVGLVGTTMFAAFTIASFPIGRVTDRFGPRPILVSGLIVYSIPILLFGFVESTAVFFLLRAIEGVGSACISVATETLISQLSEPNERARRMSYYGLSVGAGWAAGPLVGTVLFNIRPEAPFVSCFILSLVSAFIVVLLVPSTASGSHRVEGLLSVLSPAMVIPVGAGALHGYLMSSLVTLFPVYLRGIGVSGVQMGTIVTAVIVGTLISQIPIGRAADRFGKNLILLICTSSVAVIFLLLPNYSSWTSYVIAGALIGALGGSLYPVGLAIIGGLVRVERLGSANALFSLSFGLGSLIGPTMSGLAMRHLGAEWLFYVPGILTAAFALNIVALGRSAGFD